MGTSPRGAAGPESDHADDLVEHREARSATAAAPGPADAGEPPVPAPDPAPDPSPDAPRTSGPAQRRADRAPGRQREPAAPPPGPGRGGRLDALATALDVLRWAAVATAAVAALVVAVEGPAVPGWTPEAHRYELILFTPAQMTAFCLSVLWRSLLLVWALPVAAAEVRAAAGAPARFPDGRWYRALPASPGARRAVLGALAVALLLPL